MLNSVTVGNVIVSLLVPMTFASTSPAAPVESAADTPALTGVTATVKMVNGSGCPNAAGSAIVYGGGRSIRITTPAYIARTGDGAQATDFRKNCQINLEITRPEGYTYAVRQVSGSGFLYLSEGAKATAGGYVYFAGMSETSRFSQSFAGPAARMWESTGAPELQYAPCRTDRNLNVNTELRVTPGSEDLAEENVIIKDEWTTLRLDWRRC